MVAVLGSHVRAQAVEGPDPATREAVALLRRCMTPSRDGSHAVLIESLRHLRDPAARPLFERMAGAGDPQLRAAGLLGLADLADPPALDLSAAAEIEDAAGLSRLLTLALDQDLLPEGHLRRVIAWPGLDPGVKLLAAAELVKGHEAGAEVVASLVESLRDEAAPRRALAAALLIQAAPEGDASRRRAEAVLASLLDPATADREGLILLILQTAARHGMTRMGAFAVAVAEDESLVEPLRDAGVAAGLRLGQPRASQLWGQRYAAASGEAARVRWALVLLQMSPWVSPEAFAPLAASETEMLKRIGTTGAAIAGGGDGAAEAVIDLLKLGHPQLLAWAVNFGVADAPPRLGQAALLATIVVAQRAVQAEADPDARVDREAMLAGIADAVVGLFEVDAAAAARLLRPILIHENTQPPVRRAILLGLVRCRSPLAVDAAAGHAEPLDRSAASYLALLRGKHLAEVDAATLGELAQLTRSASPDVLRLQAGWAYLVHTGQLDAAVRAALKPS